MGSLHAGHTRRTGLSGRFFQRTRTQARGGDGKRQSGICRDIKPLETEYGKSPAKPTASTRFTNSRRQERNARRGEIVTRVSVRRRPGSDTVEYSVIPRLTWPRCRGSASARQVKSSPSTLRTSKKPVAFGELTHTGHSGDTRPLEGWKPFVQFGPNIYEEATRGKSPTKRKKRLRGREWMSFRMYFVTWSFSDFNEMVFFSR